MDYKLISSCRLARRLIKNGFRVLDIKPDKFDKVRTVFLFDNSSELRDYIRKYTEESGIEVE